MPHPPALREGDAKRLLPACSPDFNPIELTFSTLKTHLRGMASRTPKPSWRRLVPDWYRIGAGLRPISDADATAWYQHWGYQFLCKLYGIRSDPVLQRGLFSTQLVRRRSPWDPV